MTSCVLQSPLLVLSSIKLMRKKMVVISDGHLALYPGEIILLTGPNGSGKTTLVEFLVGDSTCFLERGKAFFKGEDLVSLAVEDRVRKGLYTAFQHVPECDLVRTETFLYEMYSTCNGGRPSYNDFMIHLKELCCFVGLSEEHLKKPLFKGFSGGEKKRLQFLELLLLKPDLAVLDEIDAGLDDAGKKIFAQVVTRLKREKPSTAFLVITHNETILGETLYSRCYQITETTLKELLP